MIRKTWELLLVGLLAAGSWACGSTEEEPQPETEREPGARQPDGTVYAGTLAGIIYLTLAEDQGDFPWSSSWSNAGADSDSDGQANTRTILGLYDGNIYPAAEACAELDAHGLADWFLPARDELNLLYERQEEIGGFGAGYYWSSTESSFNNAIAQRFSDGYAGGTGKNLSRSVRCMRACVGAGCLSR